MPADPTRESGTGWLILTLAGFGYWDGRVYVTAVHLAILTGILAARALPTIPAPGTADRRRSW